LMRRVRLFPPLLFQKRRGVLGPAILRFAPFDLQTRTSFGLSRGESPLRRSAPSFLFSLLYFGHVAFSYLVPSLPYYHRLHSLITLPLPTSFVPAGRSPPPQPPPPPPPLLAPTPSPLPFLPSRLPPRFFFIFVPPLPRTVSLVFFSQPLLFSVLVASFLVFIPGYTSCGLLRGFLCFSFPFLSFFFLCFWSPPWLTSMD